jgi:hypothetical protein
MTPEEILGKFVSGRMMVKEARYVDDALNGPLPVYEPQPVALKATSSREALPSKVAQVEAVGLNEDEMALIIKRFKTALKGHKEYPNKNKKSMGRGRRRRFTRRRRARRTLAKNGIQTALHPTPTMKDW